jgi:uncharacterized repeat protein (TIGR02543 family)
MTCYNCSTNVNAGERTNSTSSVSGTATSDYAKSGDGAAKISLLKAQKTVNYNVTYGDLPTPTRQNYTFLGWYTTSTGNTKITDTSRVETITVALYARWE